MKQQANISSEEVLSKHLNTTSPKLVTHGGVLRVKPIHHKPANNNLSGGDGSSDSGTVTAFQDNNGKLLKDCKVVFVFWGSAWSKSTTIPSAFTFNLALSDIVTGPWATQLGQYRGIGRVAVEKMVEITSSDPATKFTNSDIQAMLKSQIDNGTLPQPDNNIERLYCVLMPTGHSSGDTSFVGQHQFFDYLDAQNIFNLKVARAYYAWVTNDGTLTGGNSIPKIFSHELAESITDPDYGNPDSGILVVVDDKDTQEIGDVCNNTYSTVNGEAQEAYWSNEDNRCVLPTAQAFPAATGIPSLLQSRFGKQGNFEFVSPQQSGGLFFTWRNNDNRFMPWDGAISFAQSLGIVASATMIQSNFGSPGNLEMIIRAGDTLQFMWRDSGPSFTWSNPYQIGSPGVSGNPVLIQSRFGKVGNFELVIPLAGGGLGYYWRNNDDTKLAWSPLVVFAQSLGKVDAVTMIQSNFGSPGNMELIARVGNRLYSMWRDSGPAFTWNGLSNICQPGVSGNPVLIQSHFGTVGNFELIAPLESGGLASYWRNNDDPNLPWNGPYPFAQGLGQVQAITMIESNFGSPGNFELIVLAGNQLYSLYRDSGSLTWYGPSKMQAIVW